MGVTGQSVAFGTAYLGSWPYGDEPAAQANIEAGMQYYNNACYKK